MGAAPGVREGGVRGGEGGGGEDEADGGGGGGADVEDAGGERGWGGGGGGAAELVGGEAVGEPGGGVGEGRRGGGVVGQGGGRGVVDGVPAVFELWFWNQEEVELCDGRSRGNSHVEVAAGLGWDRWARPINPPADLGKVLGCRVGHARHGGEPLEAARMPLLRPG